MLHLKKYNKVTKRIHSTSNLMVHLSMNMSVQLRVPLMIHLKTPHLRFKFRVKLRLQLSCT